MPLVGSKEFPYTPEGEKQAAAYAKKTGQPLSKMYAGGSMKLGGGGRFAKLEGELAGKGVKNPGALAASIGRKKYGAKKFSELAAAGRKKGS